MPMSSSVPSQHCPLPQSTDEIQNESRLNDFGDLIVYRLVFASLTLSVVAICASTLMLPILLKELDELNEMTIREGKQFKILADEIWRDLLRLQQKKSPNDGHLHGQGHPSSFFRQRGRRELQMLAGESRGFLDRLERKSYKGRQRIRQSEGGPTIGQQKYPSRQKPPYWELYTKKTTPLVKDTLATKVAAATVPQANAIRAEAATVADDRNSTTTTTTEKAQTTASASTTTSHGINSVKNEMAFVARGVPIYGQRTNILSATNGLNLNEKKVIPNKCPMGPPGYSGKPGHDGIPGVPGAHGKKGESGYEIQAKFESNGGSPQCVVCPQGPPGLPGANGPQGEDGENGANGMSGTAKAAAAAVGAAGPVGDVGQPGRDAAEGPAGSPGSSGIKYLKGQPGPKGEIGPRGERGMPGENGSDGSPGSMGEIGYQGWPGEIGLPGKTGPIGSVGIQGISGAERHYCNCPVRSSQLLRLKDNPDGMGAFFGRWKGRLPNQLLDEYEKYTQEKEELLSEKEQPKKMHSVNYNQIM